MSGDAAEIDTSNIPRDPDVAIKYICDVLYEFVREKRNTEKVNSRDDGKIEDLCHYIDVALIKSNYGDELKNRLNELTEYCFSKIPEVEDLKNRLLVIRRKIIFEEKRGVAISHFANDVETPDFSLDADERSRIFKLCGEMREVIVQSDFFDDPHKNRILMRIAQIETEIYKHRGQFDVILGGVVDIGEAFGQFGKKAKPLVDLMDQIWSITHKSSPSYKELPSPESQKRLPAPENDVEERTDAE